MREKPPEGKEGNESIKCNRCAGWGKVRDAVCPDCKGSGTKQPR